MFLFLPAFALALVVFSIITPLFSSVVQRSALGGIDQGMGFLFGVARGILLVAIAFIVVNIIVDMLYLLINPRIRSV